MNYIKLIKYKIWKFLIKCYKFFYKKNITYKSKECQTDLSSDKIKNLLELENDINNIINNPKEYKWNL